MQQRLPGGDEMSIWCLNVRLRTSASMTGNESGPDRKWTSKGVRDDSLVLTGTWLDTFRIASLRKLDRLPSSTSLRQTSR
jgi:hypothetical protein